MFTYIMTACFTAFGFLSLLHVESAIPVPPKNAVAISSELAMSSNSKKRVKMLLVTKVKCRIFGQIKAVSDLTKLIFTNVSADDILNNFNRSFGDVKYPQRTSLPVLGFITPWNAGEYDRAVKHAARFTHFSPVNLNVTVENGKYIAREGAEIPEGWVKKVRAANDRIKIVPLVDLSSAFLTLDQQQDLITRWNDSEAAGAAIVQALQKYDFNGIVLTGFNHNMTASDLKNWLRTIKTLANVLGKSGYETILVFKPLEGWSSTEEFKANQLLDLSEAVTHFIIVAKDHPLALTSGGPIAPLEWIREILTLRGTRIVNPSGHLMLQLNHYGRDFAPSQNATAIINNDYLDLLRKYHPKLKWDGVAREHSFTYKENETVHTVHYPSLKSLDERIKLANELNSGVSIWELGQGLEYFLDLL